MIPVEKNKHYVIDITDVSSDGMGVGKIDGYTVFADGTVTGDKAEVLIVKTKSGYGFGKLVKITEPSVLREKPACGYFEKCGGCQLMCMNYTSQLEYKRSIVENNLKRIGGFNDIAVEPVIGMDEPYRYRNKAVFPVGISADGAVCGFYAKRSHRIVPMTDCIISGEHNKGIIEAVKEYINECGISVYDEQTHTGTIRRVFTRSGRKSGEVMAVISANADKLPEVDVLVKKIRAACPEAVSIILNVNKKRTNLVLGDKNITLYGSDKIRDTLLGITYEISPHSFYQVNPVQTERLYSKAIELAGLSGKEKVMDIYCGIGTISLCCAKRASSVTGIEIVESAIKDAKENARRNGIDNARFYAGSAEEIVPRLIESGEHPDVVMIDPPRKGSDEKTLAAICEAAPEKIVYVSCSSATLARDARYLCERGYEVRRVVPVDMFPHTVHVETVCLMSRVKE